MTTPRDESGQASVLNENQRRHFEVLLSMLEDSLVHVEELCDVSRPSDTILTVVDNDLPPRAADLARPVVRGIREQIARLASDLQLPPRRVSRRRTIRALLTSEIIRIDDSAPDQLRGYGSVDPRYADAVAPQLREIRSALVQLTELLRSDMGTPPTTSGI